MGQSLVQNYLHLVFSTKNRVSWFKTEEQRQRLYAYLAGVCKNLDTPAFQDELRRLLRLYGIEFDEHYIWD